MAVRLLHVSDTHLGKRQYGADVRRDDFAAAFGAAIDVAIDRDVDAVVHTGDLFDSRSPALPDVTRCIDTLQRLADAGIRFLGIVGNHDRKLEQQWLDLMGRAARATRLDREPTVIEDVALYGIDAVPAPAWAGADLSLAPPPGDETTICCMHQLLTPPVPPIQAEYETADVLDRFERDIDGLALGDYHEAEGATVGDTRVWYAGSTERCSAGEVAPRSVALLTIDDAIDVERIELATRPFERIEIEFGPDDGIGHVESVVGQHAVEERVVPVTLTGDRTAVSASDVRQAVLGRGAAVCRVDDDRGRDDLQEACDVAGDVPDRETVIERRLDGADLDPFVLELEGTVRAASSATGLDEEIEERVDEVAAKPPEDRTVAESSDVGQSRAVDEALAEATAPEGTATAETADAPNAEMADTPNAEMADARADETSDPPDSEPNDTDGEPDAADPDDEREDAEREERTEEKEGTEEDPEEPTPDATATLAQFGGDDAD